MFKKIGKFFFNGIIVWLTTKRSEIEEAKENAKFKIVAASPQIKLNIYKQLLDKESVTAIYYYRISFFKNELGQRKYKIHGEPKENFQRTEYYTAAEFWMASGILPEWAKDIVVMKLEQ